jgi:hypothetical protein
MTFEETHPLLWITKPTHTTNFGSCGCGGFEVWANTREEIKAAHKGHLNYLRSLPEPSTPVHTLAVSSGHELHTLQWSGGAGRLVGSCKGCNWRVDTRPRWKIEELFQTHLANLPQTY